MAKLVIDPSQCTPEAVGARMRLIRGDETQHNFAVRITAATGQPFLPGRISKLESGDLKATLVDLAVLAIMDTDRRGVLWLAYGIMAKDLPPELSGDVGEQAHKRRSHR